MIPFLSLLSGILIFSWILVIAFPPLLAYIVGGVLVLLGVNLLAMVWSLRRIRHGQEEEKVVQFGKYTLYRK